MSGEVTKVTQIWAEDGSRIEVYPNSLDLCVVIQAYTPEGVAADIIMIPVLDVDAVKDALTDAANAPVVRKQPCIHG